MFDWTDDRIATLRGCVAAAQSSGDAAKLLDPTGQLSRNAVTSKAQKLGLKFNSRSSGTAKKPQPRRRRHSVHSEETLAQYAGGKLPPVAFTPDPDSVDADAIPVGQRVSLLELTNITCRFPYGEPGADSFFFCGARNANNAAGIPYCPLHSRIAYNLPVKPLSERRGYVPGVVAS